MTSFTTREAAEQTGLSKSTIKRAIKSGKLSAAKDDNDAYLIDAAELFRVYPQKPAAPAAKSIRNDPVHLGPVSRPEPDHDAILLARELELLKEERRREREDAQATIDDLRKRLDAEAEERRAQTKLLTHQKAEQPQKRSFFKIFAGS